MGRFGEGIKTGILGLGESGLCHTAARAPDGTLYLTVALLSQKLNRVRGGMIKT